MYAWKRGYSMHQNHNEKSKKFPKSAFIVFFLAMHIIVVLCAVFIPIITVVSIIVIMFISIYLLIHKTILRKSADINENVDVKHDSDISGLIIVSFIISYVAIPLIILCRARLEQNVLIYLLIVLIYFVLRVYIKFVFDTALRYKHATKSEGDNVISRMKIGFEALRIIFIIVTVYTRYANVEFDMPPFLEAIVTTIAIDTVMKEKEKIDSAKIV